MLKKIVSLLSALTILIFYMGCASDEEFPDSTNDPVAEVPSDPVEFSLNIEITPQNGGSINVSGGLFDDGTSIELEVTPNSIINLRNGKVICPAKVIRAPCSLTVIKQLPRYLNSMIWIKHMFQTIILKML